jgi:hypothetical protein
MRHLRQLALTCLTCVCVLSASSASGAIVLTFNVSNVMRNDCTGALQPSCTLSAAAGFTQRLLLNGPLLQAIDGGVPGFRQTSASYGLSTLLDPTPYTSALSSRLTGPVTDDFSLTQLDNFYDDDNGMGTGGAQFLWDQLSDTTDRLGVRAQQEYKLGYNFLSSLLTTPAWYTDLVNESADTFFQRYANAFTGTYDELGTASALDPNSLLFTSYAFTEYTGDVRLTLAEQVPEPDTLLLTGLAFVGLLLIHRRRGARVHTSPGA